MRRGRFISFEGVDGAGKSTHIQRVKEAIVSRGHRCEVTREPGGTALSEKIRELVLHDDMQTRTELLLMYAARVEHVETRIKPALNAGIWILTDRFEDSSFAYQGQGNNPGWPECEALSQWALNGFCPDLTFLFDLPVSVSMQRVTARQGQTDRFEVRPQAYFELVRQGFLRRANEHPGRIKVLDAQQPEDAVGKQVLEIFLEFMKFNDGLNAIGEGQV